MEKVLIWSQSQDSQPDMIARDLDFLIRVALEWGTYYSFPVIEIPTLGVQHSFLQPLSLSPTSCSVSSSSGLYTPYVNQML